MNMAMNNDPNMPPRDSSMLDRDATVVGTESGTFDRGTTPYEAGATGGVGYDRGTGSSNFLAYLIGGLVIALGLLAFLFYDGGGMGRDVTTTGSTTPRVTAPASPSGPSATPATPSAPAPAAPANPR
jgi:hypothetical protein